MKINLKLTSLHLEVLNLIHSAEAESYQIENLLCITVRNQLTQVQCGYFLYIFERDEKNLFKKLRKFTEISARKFLN